MFKVHRQTVHGVQEFAMNNRAWLRAYFYTVDRLMLLLEVRSFREALT